MVSYSTVFDMCQLLQRIYIEKKLRISYSGLRDTAVNAAMSDLTLEVTMGILLRKYRHTKPSVQQLV